MGVWIETSQAGNHVGEMRVTPCMGVWIETPSQCPMGHRYLVTPCMGVWIETVIAVTGHKEPNVTPCMGVWIETSSARCCRYFAWSHPVWVCGLKQPYRSTAKRDISHTLYGCVD